MTLEATAAIVALVGLWLLVLGPAYQAIVEVTAQRRELGSVLDAVALVRVRPVERWWWLLPPIAVLLWWSRLRSHLRTIEDRLPEVSGRRWTHYLDSAVGWGIVATGALVVATGQTILLAGIVPASVAVTSWCAGVLVTVGMSATMISRRV